MRGCCQAKAGLHRGMARLRSPHASHGKMGMPDLSQLPLASPSHDVLRTQ